jgi:hypothetical protein
MAASIKITIRQQGETLFTGELIPASTKPLNKDQLLDIEMSMNRGMEYRVWIEVIEDRALKGVKK